MVSRSRFLLGAVTMAAASLLAACDGGGGGGAGGSTNTGGSGGAGAEGGATTTSEGGGGEGGATTTSTTGTEAPGCQNNTECVNSPTGPICNTDSGLCVSCIPSDNAAADCGVGSWCVPSSGQCEAGCTSDVDCPSADGSLVCDLEKHVCVGCIGDDNCPLGSICLNQQCLPGCSPTHACQPGLTCCGQQCFDLAADENNCGACNFGCTPVNNAEVVCTNGQCLQGNCTGAFADCNGSTADGCETNTIVDGACVCDPGETQACYLGAPGTQGVGPCKAGTRTCAADGLSWGACQGQVLPQAEVCANGIDENCDSILDNASDMDGDGWTTCEGDCNDADALINPGALEVTYTLVDADNNPMTPPVVTPGGNGIDDDCDPATSDTVNPAACGPAGSKLSGVTATDVANAMDLCQSTTANPPKPQKKWGMLSSAFKVGSGADPNATQLSNMQNAQAAIMVQYGYLNNNPAVPNNAPKKGPTMAGLSSGRMRYVGQTGYASPNGGTSLASASSCPAAYMQANGNSLPSSQGCSGANCLGGDTCNDSIMVRLQVRVPTNAKSMSYDFKFFSGEFPEYVCTTFNDFYLALLTTGAPGIPADKNVSFDALGNGVSVNNGFFDVCSPTGCFTCPKGTAELAGTGMESSVGGGTSWLTTDAPVIGGETITLDLLIFDVGDNSWDSHVLVDNFRWGLNTTAVGTHE